MNTEEITASKKEKGKSRISPVSVSMLICMLAVGLIFVIASVSAKFSGTFAKNLFLPLQSAGAEVFVQNACELDPASADLPETVSASSVGTSLGGISFEHNVLYLGGTLSGTDTDSAISLKVNIFNNTKNSYYFAGCRSNIAAGSPVSFSLFDENGLPLAADDGQYVSEGDGIIPPDPVLLNPDSDLTFYICFRYSGAYIESLEEDLPDQLENLIDCEIAFRFGRGLSFDPNGGEMPDTAPVFVCTDDSELQLSIEKPYKTGYVFTGWYDGQGLFARKVFDADQCFCDISSPDLETNGAMLYAGWRPIRYKIYFHGIGSGNLPDTYSELEYIESLGSQYVDLGVGVSSNSKIEIKFSPNEFSSWIYGNVYSAGDTKDVGISRNSIRFGSQYYSSPSDLFENGQDVTVKMDSSGYSINGVRTDWPQTAVLSTNMPLRAFFANNSAAKTMGGRIYYIKIYENGILAHHYIPCRDSQNAGNAGLYDVVDASVGFCENKGTGTFSLGALSGVIFQDLEYDKPETLKKNSAQLEGLRFAGWNTETDGTGRAFSDEEEVVNLCSCDGDVLDLYSMWSESQFKVRFYPQQRVPAGYVELPDLIGDGRQYIDLGLIPGNDPNFGLEIKFRYNNDSAWIIGAVNTSGVPDDIGIANNCIRYGTQYIKSSGSARIFEKNEIYTVRVDSSGYSINGEFTAWPGVPSINVSKSMFCFWANGSSAAKGGEIFYIKTFEGDDVSHEFIPAYRMSDGVGGLYDVTGDNFLAQASGGSPFEFETMDVPEQLCSFGNEETLLACSYEKTGYVFSGWNTVSDGSGVSYSDEEPVDNLICPGDELNLFAQWRPAEYSVRLLSAQLSSDYRTIEYVQSDGTQFVDTGLTKASIGTVEMDICWTKLPNLYAVNGWSNDVQIGITQVGKWHNWQTSSLYASVDSWYTAKLELDHASESGTLSVKDLSEPDLPFTEAISYNFGQNQNTFYIFATHSESKDDAEYYASEKISRVLIKDPDGRIIRDMVPCVKNDSNTYGLYDLVGAVFYASGTASQLTGGGDSVYREVNTVSAFYDQPLMLPYVDPIQSDWEFVGWNTTADYSGTTYKYGEPAMNLTDQDGAVIDLYAVIVMDNFSVKYIDLEENVSGSLYRVPYLESPNNSGSNFVSSGFSKSQLGRVELDLLWTKAVNTYQMNGWADDVQIGINSQGYWHCWQTGSLKSEIGTWYTARLDLDHSTNTGTLYIKGLGEADSSYVQAVSHSFGTNSSEFALFAAGDGGTGKFFACEQISAARFYDQEGTLIGNIVPCFDAEDGTVSMYDTVRECELALNGNFKMPMSETFAERHSGQHLNPSVFTKAGFVLDSWNTKPDGSGISFSPDELIDNIEIDAERIYLFPIWK